jgi:hypothetical protein
MIWLGQFRCPGPNGAPAPVGPDGALAPPEPEPELDPEGAVLLTGGATYVLELALVEDVLAAVTGVR